MKRDRTRKGLGLLVASVGLAASGFAGCKDRSPPVVKATPEEPAWQLVALNLSSALLSIDGASDSNIFAVGADKGDGPLVLHYDGKAWAELPTGQHGDLWWVHAFPDGTALMAGAGALVLKFDGSHFERIPTHGLARQTVYGVWGTSMRDFYAVGSAAGRNGFVWHYQSGAFHDEALPSDLPLASMGEPPGFFKAWGAGDEVWVVGSAGSILHRKGDAPFARVATETKDTLFTVHGASSSSPWLAVGGGSSGVILERSAAGVRDVSPPGAALIQGVFTTADADWVSGERGAIFTRAHQGEGSAPFHNVEHGLPIPVGSSLHSIFVDSAKGIWAVGGNVLTPALDAGMIVHFGTTVPEVMLHESPEENGATAMEAAPACPASVAMAAKDKSIARRWDEQALAAIRLDLPRPTVHARNLFHMSAAMWDAWAAYGNSEGQVFVDERARVGKGAPSSPENLDEARKKSISYAAYGILTHRYEHAIGGATTVACLRAVMKDLGYDAADTHEEGDDPIALGNRIAHKIIQQFAHDGSNEDTDYGDPQAFVSPNPPLVYDNPGATMMDPNIWQPLNLSVAATQNGIILPAGVQTYIGSQWGAVPPFAMTRASDAVPWQPVDPTPKVGKAMKRWLVEVLEKESAVDPRDGVMIDISPGAYGHNSLGANDGKGWAKNPVTGKPYAPEIVPRADFARVMAEFWADGPKSETPPGHWNVLANHVSDSPEFSRRLHGHGAPLDPLAWDLHMYLALNGALHDAAIAAWDLKRRTVSSRPICLIRWMGAKGQASDPSGPSYDADGLPLVPGLVEVVTKESSAKGQRHAHLAAYVGQVAVRGWNGEPGDRKAESSGVSWIRAVDWVPYQRRNFVTPAFPGYISGHSTFSRAGATVLEALTGSPFFPGGFAEFVAPASTFLQFESGPSREVRLQWASYADASDEAGQSRIWGGIHIEPDDFMGRRVGRRVGLGAVEKAESYFHAEKSL